MIVPPLARLSCVSDKIRELAYRGEADFLILSLSLRAGQASAHFFVTHTLRCFFVFAPVVFLLFCRYLQDRPVVQDGPVRV